MTVYELSRILSDLPLDAKIVIASDSEGNSFLQVDGWSADYMYIPETARRGNIKKKELTSDDLNNGYTEEDVYDGKNGLDCIVLWPR